MDVGLLETHEVRSSTMCAFECVANDKCLSYNYQHDSNSEWHSCELLDRTKKEALLTARAGYTHYETVTVRIASAALRAFFIIIKDSSTGSYFLI